MGEARFDLELLAAWGDGGQSAGRALVERHLHTVHRFLRNEVECGLEADDLEGWARRVRDEAP